MMAGTMYTIVPQVWPGKPTYYAQLKWMDTATLTIEKVFECRHHHRTLDDASQCQDVKEARTRDMDRRR